MSSIGNVIQDFVADLTVEPYDIYVNLAVDFPKGVCDVAENLPLAACLVPGRDNYTTCAGGSDRR